MEKLEGDWDDWRTGGLDFLPGHGISIPRMGIFSVFDLLSTSSSVLFGLFIKRFMIIHSLSMIFPYVIAETSILLTLQPSVPLRRTSPRRGPRRWWRKARWRNHTTCGPPNPRGCSGDDLPSGFIKHGWEIPELNGGLNRKIIDK